MSHSGHRTPTQRIVAVTMGFSVLPGIIGLVTEHWLTDDVIDRHVGLWKYCDEQLCHPLTADEKPEWYDAVRGLGIMSMCLHIIAVVTGACCASLATYDDDFETFSYFPRAEEITAFMAGILHIGGLARFACSARTHPLFTAYRFGWSFWLCVVHVCLVFICATLITLGRDKWALVKMCSQGDCSCRKRRRSPQSPRSQVYKKASEFAGPKKNGSTYQMVGTKPKSKKNMSNRPGSGKPLPPREIILRFQFEHPPHSIGKHEGRTNSAGLLSNLETLKLPEYKQYFCSLEGIPRVLRFLARPKESEIGMVENVDQVNQRPLDV